MGAVDILHREGEVERAERDMFGGLLELSEIPVSDVMVHRTKIQLIDADLPPEELVREVIASPYTRMPLWRGEPDNIVGVLHAKDLLRAYVAAGGDASKVNIAGLMLAALVHPRVDDAARSIAGVPAPQDPFRAGRRRIWRRAGAGDARGHYRGDRRRHSRRA